MVMAVYPTLEHTPSLAWTRNWTHIPKREPMSYTTAEPHKQHKKHKYANGLQQVTECGDCL